MLTTANLHSALEEYMQGIKQKGHEIEGPEMHDAVEKVLRSIRINISIRDTSSPDIERET